MNLGRPERWYFVGQSRDDGCLNDRVGDEEKEKRIDFIACLHNLVIDWMRQGN